MVPSAPTGYSKRSARRSIMPATSRATSKPSYGFRGAMVAGSIAFPTATILYRPLTGSTEDRGTGRRPSLRRMHHGIPTIWHHESTAGSPPLGRARLQRGSVPGDDARDL